MKYFVAGLALTLCASCTTDTEITQPLLSQEAAQDDFIFRQSPNDDRNYRYIILDNALRVFLVSDPKTDKAAASLVVLRGQNHDPEQFGGLAIGHLSFGDLGLVLIEDRQFQTDARPHNQVAMLSPG